MSGCLEGLTNPLSSLAVLDTEMKWRGNWAVGTQYYLHDVVRSPTNGIEYILTGKTALLGGLDPGSLAITTTDWVALGGIASTSQNPAFADAGAGSGSYVITGGNLIGAPANSRWLVSFQGLRTGAAANTSADTDTITFTAPGGDVVVVDIMPNLRTVGTTQTNFSISGVIQTVAAGDIVMTGIYNPARLAAAYTGDKVSYIRLA